MLLETMTGTCGKYTLMLISRLSTTSIYIDIKILISIITLFSLTNNGFTASPSIDAIDSTDGVSIRSDRRSKSPDQEKRLYLISFLVLTNWSKEINFCPNLLNFKSNNNKLR